MAVVLQSTTFSVPEADALQMRGLQTDPYNEIYGGHKALFDFDTSGMPDSLAVDDEIANVVHDAAAGVCKGAFGAGLQAAHGLLFEDNSEGGAAERLDIPAAAFDFNQLGVDPSFVLSTWVTLGAKDTADGFFNSLMGFAFQTNVEHQWSLYQAGTGGDDLRLALSTSVGNTDGFTIADLTAHAGSPILLTMYVERTAAGVFTMRGYRDAAVAGTLTGRGYSFNSPVTGAATPRIGTLGGFGNRIAATVHRLQLLKVDPDVFDIDEWLAAEIAGNAGRFV